MASSNIKLFDENKGNMLSDSEFGISNQRLNGLQTGVASSQLQNKAMYQASLIAYAIAQVMMQNGKNANDTDAVSAFVANLSGTMLQKVYDIATTAEAQAGIATGKWMSPALVKAAIDTLAAKAQNILSDETKALFGLGADAVPDDVLALIKTLVDNAQISADSKAKIEKQNYTGTGAAGPSAQTSVTFSFVPKIVFLSLLTDNGSSLSNYVNCALLIPSTGRGAMFYDRSFVRLYVSLNEKTVSWYSVSSNVDEQLNRSGWEYEAYAIG